MLPEKLPKCLCGERKWNPRGANLSSLSQQGFKCDNCERDAHFLSHAGGNVFLVALEPSSGISDSVNYWLNAVLMPTWRDAEERLKEARKPMEELWLELACQTLSLPSGSTFDQVPKELQKQWWKHWDLLRTFKSYLKPSGFTKPPIPPKLPAGLTAFLCLSEVQGEYVWEQVNREESLAQSVPPDPIRTKHDAFFADVFRTLRDQLGCDIDPELTANEYYPSESEPWFKFRIGENRFVVGPRKRVTAIKLYSPQGIATEEIRTIATALNVTYIADDAWQGGAVSAKSIEVHAWNKEQLLQFLGILGKQSLLTSVS